MRSFNYTGVADEVPHDATHITVDQSVTVIPEEAFYDNRSIVEVIFGPNVKRVEDGAFNWCPSLRRLIMPGVEVVERGAFADCKALTDVECGKLEIIRELAFRECTSLRSIDLPSVKIVKGNAFAHTALTDVTFGSKLERMERWAFARCPLERITIPLKDGVIAADNIFQGCANLRHVDLAQGELTT
eukprot:scaffold18984_cov211-Skeletonema_marinoi.AAC.7